MFYFVFEATPRRDHPKSDNLAGAIINCWIVRSTQAEAEAVARTMIANEGWIVDEPDEAHPVDRTDYDDASPGLQDFEQAVIDKEVLIFHVFPILEDPNADEPDGGIDGE